MKKMACILGVLALVATAHADLYVNEVLGNTEGTDWEFIEIYNGGPDAIDLGGYQVELWDSDVGSGGFGGADGGSPFVIADGTILAAGGFFTFGNQLAADGLSFTPDVLLPDNSIENSSYTIILADPANMLDTLLVIDSLDDIGGANRAGDPITPGATFGPDGTFMPAGFYRVGDGGAELALLEFNHPHPSATPGAPNIPEPASLLLLGLAGMFLRRR